MCAWIRSHPQKLIPGFPWSSPGISKIVSTWGSPECQAESPSMIAPTACKWIISLRLQPCFNGLYSIVLEKLEIVMAAWFFMMSPAHSSSCNAAINHPTNILTHSHKKTAIKVELKDICWWWSSGMMSSSKDLPLEDLSSDQIRLRKSKSFKLKAKMALHLAKTATFSMDSNLLPEPGNLIIQLLP